MLQKKNVTYRSARFELAGRHLVVVVASAAGGAWRLPCIAQANSYGRHRLGAQQLSSWVLSVLMNKPPGGGDCSVSSRRFEKQQPLNNKSQQKLNLTLDKQAFQ